MLVSSHRSSGQLDDLIAQKLIAFERIEADFKQSFLFVEEVHGQRRFTAFPVANSVRYLHALWRCECKDRLLGVPQTIERYEGERCLRLLLAWHEGRTTDVIAFLQRKLDSMPFAMLTQQIEAAEQMGNSILARRLAHGRMILLNRSFNLAHALDAICRLPSDELVRQVREACIAYGHSGEQITQQLAELSMPLYTATRHAELARRNMLVMNALGVSVSDNEADRPGERTERTALPASPMPPYAEVPIVGETTLSSMANNNPQHADLAMPPLPEDGPQFFTAEQQVRT